MRKTLSQPSSDTLSNPLSPTLSPTLSNSSQRFRTTHPAPRVVNSTQLDPTRLKSKFLHLLPRKQSLSQPLSNPLSTFSFSAFQHVSVSVSTHPAPSRPNSTQLDPTRLKSKSPPRSRGHLVPNSQRLHQPP